MKKLLFAVAAVLALGACAPKVEKVAGISYENMDLTVKPGDDFAKYATGLWAQHNPQPPQYPMWGTTTKVSDENVTNLAELIKEIAANDNKKGTVAQKIGDLYNLMMDSTRLNNDGALPIKKYLKEIEDIQTREEFIEYCAKNHDNLFFSLGVTPDEKNATQNIVYVGERGLSLGSRDYYVSDDPNMTAVCDAMKKYMVKLFILAGYTESEANTKMQQIWTLESELAIPYYSLEQQRDPEGNYHKVSVEELTAMTGGFDWKSYLNNYRYDKTTEVDLGQPEPVAKGCELLMKAPLEALKAKYEFATISGAASLLSDDFSDATFEFNQTVYGTAEKYPRWMNAESLVNNVMSDAVGQMFVEKYFSAEAKAEMLEMIDNLMTSLGERIKAQEWMSDQTKAVALDKLASYTVKVGYPDKWDDLSGLNIDPELSLYENVYNASLFYWDLNYEKEYNKPVDKDAWAMSPQTVNAYYNPTSNEICFPAGFLQPPLFDLKSDAAANYGCIGVVIGHEMTHGFDDQGAQYDKNGNLNNWWSAADVEAFKKPCQQMADYFNTLWVIPDELHANGVACLGENIADHGGINIAYDALQLWQNKHGRLPDDNGFTPEQRFFLSYANAWAGTASDAILRYLTINDVHSVDFLRVNGALSQIDTWYDAFNIQPGDAYYVAPENRVRIW